jgi:predicted phage gp36 major capsid-like protein
MTDQLGDGWQEHRLLVLAMLERHEAALEDCKRERYEDREKANERLREHLKEMKTEIMDELRPSVEVQAANITGAWQFWAAVATSVGAIVVAVFALLN